MTTATAKGVPFLLVQEILARSLSATWDAARLEWGLDHIYLEDDPPGTCLCSHFPIVEHCVLANRRNGKMATVGNCCVKRFLAVQSGRLFDALRRVSNDPTAALNAAMIRHAHERGWLTDWEYTFYLNTWRKRRLSHRQRIKRQQINDKVLRLVREDKIL
jgi:hypothetical protein